ncbi:MAG: hypothetical protein GY774_24260 [Planctomycetes bacterium]|nr:hypothetical protein [Planctomycetota bacterium]
MHDENPADVTEGFNPHRHCVESQKNQGNCDVSIITGISPMYQFTDQVLLAFLFAETIMNVYKKYFENWE